MKSLIIFLLTSSTLFAQSRYEIICDSAVAAKSLQILTLLEGTQEKTKKNDGAKILDIQRSCGIPAGSAYCAATLHISSGSKSVRSW